MAPLAGRGGAGAPDGRRPPACPEGRVKGRWQPAGWPVARVGGGVVGARGGGMEMGMVVGAAQARTSGRARGGERTLTPGANPKLSPGVGTLTPETNPNP